MENFYGDAEMVEYLLYDSNNNESDQYRLQSTDTYPRDLIRVFQRYGMTTHVEKDTIQVGSTVAVHYYHTYTTLYCTQSRAQCRP